MILTVLVDENGYCFRQGNDAEFRLLSTALYWILGASLCHISELGSKPSQRSLRVCPLRRCRWWLVWPKEANGKMNGITSTKI